MKSLSHGYEAEIKAFWEGSLLKEEKQCCIDSLLFPTDTLQKSLNNIHQENDDFRRASYLKENFKKACGLAFDVCFHILHITEAGNVSILLFPSLLLCISCCPSVNSFVLEQFLFFDSSTATQSAPSNQSRKSLQHHYNLLVA